MPDRLPVLALHGWMGRGDDWAPVAAALDSSTRVLLHDLPGHGQEACEDADFTMDGAASTVIAALDAAGAGRAVVAGYSMGGRVALHLALLHPDRIAGLVLVSASPGLRTDSERAARRALDAGRAQSLVADPARFVAEWYAAPLFDPLPAPARAALAADRLAHGSPAAWAKALAGLSPAAQPWYGDSIAGIGIPTAVLAGAVDAKFTALAHEMAGDGRFDATIIPGAGHALLVERPDAVAGAIAEVTGRSG